MDKTPKLLTLKATAEEIGCGRHYVSTLLKEKKLKSVLVGKRPRVVASSIDRYIKTQAK
jgi:excisionase family DNA binding protein